MQTQALTHLEAERSRLLAKRQRLLDAFVKSAGSGKQKRLAAIFGKIHQTNGFIEILNEIEGGLNDAEPPELPATRRRYAISSLFLHESFKKLTADQDEQFFFITGNEVDGVLVLDQWAEFAHQKRSMVGVTADTRSTHKLLIKLEQFGHRLLGHFHSHPGMGEDATRPSGIDENFQERLEGAGHLAVMAIFSRDGFVRFVRLDQNLEIEVHGTGVEKHAPAIYRLTNFDQA